MQNRKALKRRYCYEIWGALIPEWTSISIPMIKLAMKTDEFDLDIEVYFHGSNFNIAIFSKARISEKLYSSLINYMKNLVHKIVNFISIQFQGSYQVSFRYFSDNSREQRIVLGVTEPIFDNPKEGFTFSGQFQGIPAVVFANPFIGRALSELDQSVSRPSLTLMHCRIALESCMQNFSVGRSKSEAWAALSSALNVKSTTIAHLLEISHAQRHGEIVNTKWQQRKEIMQIAWEVVNRLILLEQNKVNGMKPPIFSNI